MILPNKHVKQEEALIGVGGILLEQIALEGDFSILWDKVKNIPNVATFERFVLSLDLLFTLGLISLNNNRIVRTDP